MDEYFHIPDDVAQGGVRGALERGTKDIPLTTLLYQLADCSDNLGKSDRIHLFAMLCGGGTKLDTDEIEDVKFSLDGLQLIAKVKVRTFTKEVHCTVTIPKEDNEAR